MRASQTYSYNITIRYGMDTLWSGDKIEDAATYAYTIWYAQKYKDGNFMCQYRGPYYI